MNDLTTITLPVSLFDRPGLIDEVIAGVLSDKSMFTIAVDLGLPPAHLMMWVRKNHAEEYAHALAVYDDILAHDALKIADKQKSVLRDDGTEFDPEVPRDTLRVGTRLKLIGRGDVASMPSLSDSGRRPIEMIHRVIIDSALRSRT